MLLPVRTQIQSRRSRVYTSRRFGSSQSSLASHLTAETTGSAHSTSTVTQESFNRKLREDAHRQDHHTKQRKRRHKKKRSMQPQGEESEKEQQDTDVFSYLEIDVPLLVPQNDQGPQRSYETYNESLLRTEFEHQRIAGSHTSDSGISGCDSVTESPHSDDTSKHGYLLPLAEEQDLTLAKISSSPASSETRSRLPSYASCLPAYISPGYSVPREQSAGASQQEAFCRTSNIPNPQSIASGLNGALQATTATEDASRKYDEPPQSGYDLLAAKLSDADEHESLPLLYRRFSRLGNRMLLQLQDEIVEMEADLAVLDKEDARQRSRLYGKRFPSSRRMDWMWQASPVQAQRLDLLSKIQNKLDQYGNVMLLHQKMRRQTTPASHDELNRYRTWLKEDRPLSDLEMKFLDDVHDVVSLSRNPGISTTAQQGGPSSLSTFYLLTSTAIHLLLFKHVLHQQSRVVMVFLSAAVLASVEGRQNTASRLGWECWAVWLTCSVLAAALS